MRDAARGQVWLIAFAALASACGRHGSSTPPSLDGGLAAVVTPLPTCSDLPKCEEACRQGVAHECLTAGGSYDSGRGASQDQRRATELFERACALGSGPGCNQAGRMYEFGHGVAQDLTKAFTLDEAGCRLNDLGSCYNEAVLIERGRGTAPDQRQAAVLYQRVCAAGSSIACAAAARLSDGASPPDGGAGH